MQYDEYTIKIADNGYILKMTTDEKPPKTLKSDFYNREEVYTHLIDVFIRISQMGNNKELEEDLALSGKPIEVSAKKVADRVLLHDSIESHKVEEN